MNLEEQLEKLVETKRRVSARLDELDKELSTFPNEENFDLKTRIILEKHLEPVLRKLQIVNGINREQVFQRLWEMLIGTKTKLESVAVLLLQTDIDAAFKEKYVLDESVKELLEKLDPSREAYFDRIRADFSKGLDELSGSRHSFGSKEDLLRKKSFLERELLVASTEIEDLEILILNKKKDLSSRLENLLLGLGAGARQVLEDSSTPAYGPLSLLTSATVSLLTDDLAQELLSSKSDELQALLSARLSLAGTNGNRHLDHRPLQLDGSESTLEELVFERSTDNFEIFYLDTDSRRRVVAQHFVENLSADLRLEFYERTLLGAKLNHYWYQELIERSESLAIARMDINKWLLSQRRMNLISFADYLQSRYPALSASEEFAIAWLVNVTEEGRSFPEFLTEI